MPAKAHSISSLRLDLEAARAGRTWLLLPEGFRDQASGAVYPLPTTGADLQALAGIYIPGKKRDSGCLYLKRAFTAWRTRGARKESVLYDVERRVHEIHAAHAEFGAALNRLQREASTATATVQTHAQMAVASLDHLFALGRKGIEGQMQAHLAGTEWQGEKVTARAFRECFRMVSQAVKGLGLPTPERDAAQKAVVDELAASMEATKDALTLAAPEPKEVEH